MAGLPDITITGTLVADPELRFTPNGHAVANFTVAANDRRLNRDTGNWEDAGATFLRCSLWKDAAENLTNSLNKGERVLLTGRLRQREWTTPEGDTRQLFEVDVTEIGPSLRFATASVTKATRTAAGQGSPAGADPLAAAPAAGNGAPVSDEPPF